MSLKIYNNTVLGDSKVKVYTDTDALKMYGNEVWRKKADEWETLFSGSAEFNWSGGLDFEGHNVNDKIYLTADITFSECVAGGTPNYYGQTINIRLLPTTVDFNQANVYFSVSNGRLNFTFNFHIYDFKGIKTLTTPTKVVIKEIRRKI